MQSPKMTQQYQHYDQLGQLILTDQMVAFSSSYHKGVLLGRVTKLTPKKVRIAYQYSYYYKDKLVQYDSCHISNPNDVIILNDATQQYITLSTLSNSK